MLRDFKRANVIFIINIIVNEKRRAWNFEKNERAVVAESVEERRGSERGKKGGEGAKRRDKGNIEITNLTGASIRLSSLSPLFPSALVSFAMRTEEKRKTEVCTWLFVGRRRVVSRLHRGGGHSSSNRPGVKERRTNDAATEQLERKEKERVKRRGERKKGSRRGLFDLFQRLYIYSFETRL